MKQTIVKNKKIFITGGAGYLGRQLIDKIYKDNKIVIYSRDEAKHYNLKAKYPNIEFILGDIRDKEHLIRSSKGANIGIFAASLKQISACDENPEEAIKTILFGAINSKYAAIENEFESATFISTDKSRAATTIYGSLKFAAGEQFILKNNYEKESKTKLSTIVYGNVLNSTGSIIPMLWKAINEKEKIKLYSSEMTRFLIDSEEAVDLIFKGLNIDGASIIPRSKSIKISDLFELYREKFNLIYDLGKPRVGEKIHEIMASKEEIRRLRNSECGTFFILEPIYSESVLGFDGFKNFSEYSSKDFLISKEELKLLLEKYNYFRP